MGLGINSSLGDVGRRGYIQITLTMIEEIFKETFNQKIIYS